MTSWYDMTSRHHIIPELFLRSFDKYSSTIAAKKDIIYFYGDVTNIQVHWIQNIRPQSLWWGCDKCSRKINAKYKDLI